MAIPHRCSPWPSPIAVAHGRCPLPLPTNPRYGPLVTVMGDGDG